jgi:ribonuclease P protein component
MRKGGGPLAVFLKATDRSTPRLGLSIGRGVGGAAVRARLKRMIREAFRLNQAAIPAREGGSYDVVVSARAHEPLTLEQYAGILLDLIGQAARELARRKPRREGDPS